MSEEKTDGVREGGDRPRGSEIESSPVGNSSPGVIVFPVGPAMAAALRKRQKEEREQAERESTGEKTGGDDSGEETATNG